MTHPFIYIHPLRRPRYFYSFLALTFLLLMAMNFIGLPLNTTTAPQGIISFEFAATPAHAQAMLDSWNPAAKVRLGFIQGLDFLFPLAYSSTVSLGCIWAADVLERRNLTASRWGGWLAWGQWAAVLFDYIENIGLVALLFGWVVSPIPQIAAICALFKFILLILGMIYAFFGLAIKITPEKV